MSTPAEQTLSNDVFNVPNQLTFARLVLAIVVFALIPLQLYLAALIVFVIAASTDWVDGYYARRFNQVSKLGRIFDPFVDKFIICGTFIFLAAEPGSKLRLQHPSPTFFDAALDIVTPGSRLRARPWSQSLRSSPSSQRRS